MKNAVPKLEEQVSKLTKTECIDDDKVDFIVEQANRLYDFALASREILSKEASTTMQWLFGIIVGGSGYIVTLFRPLTPTSPTPWVPIITLGVVVLVAGIAAIRLLVGALMTSGVNPPGNLPSNLANDEQIVFDARMIRLQEIMQLEQPTKDAIKRNNDVGGRINEARWVIAALPLLAVLVLIISRL